MKCNALFFTRYTLLKGFLNKWDQSDCRSSAVARGEAGLGHTQAAAFDDHLFPAGLQEEPRLHLEQRHIRNTGHH